MGVGWEWERKFHSHGNRVKRSIIATIIAKTCPENFCNIEALLRLKYQILLSW